MIVAQLSDLHIDVPGSANVHRVARMLARLGHVRPRPALVLLTGDLTQDGTAAQYELLRELLRGWAPCALLPGNHDDAALLHAMFPQASPPPGGLLRLDAGEIAVLVADSTVAGRDHGELPPRQLQAMADSIDTAGKPVLLAMHHPPVAAQVPAMEGLGLREPQRFAAWLGERPGVAAVLAGHYHQAQFCVVAGRPVLIAPSVAPSLRPDFGAPRFRTETTAPAALLHLWRGGLSSHVLLATPGAAAHSSEGKSP